MQPSSGFSLISKATPIFYHQVCEITAVIIVRSFSRLDSTFGHLSSADQSNLSPATSLTPYYFSFYPPCQVHTSDSHSQRFSARLSYCPSCTQIPLHLLWPWNTLPGRLFTEGASERRTPGGSCIFYIFWSIFDLAQIIILILIFPKTWHSFSWPFVPIQYRTGRLPQQSRTINTALAGVTQCCGQWGVRLCHLILQVMPRLKRERQKEERRERERSQGNVYGGGVKGESVNVKLCVQVRLGVTADKCSFSCPGWCCGSNTLV